MAQPKSSTIEYHQFQPSKPFIVFLIDPRLRLTLLEAFIRQAEKTASFVLYILRSGNEQHSETIEMAVALNEPDTSITTIFLFNIASLDSLSATTFSLISSLFKAIFHQSKLIVSWDEHYVNLDCLFDRSFLPRRPSITAKFILLNEDFKEWYQHRFPHELSCLPILHPLSKLKICSCSHRSLFSFSYRWTVSHAIQSVFNESIDHSSHLLSEMSIQRLVMGDKDTPIKSVFCCLAILKFGQMIQRSYGQP